MSAKEATLTRLNHEAIQARLLEILVWLDQFCRENQVQYMLCSGTCLGAIRHQGFIPWDDDADVFMDRENYQKFCALLAEKKQRFELFTCETHPDYFYPYGKLVDTTTTLVDNKIRPLANYGLYVDIFPVDGLPNDPRKRKKHFRRLYIMHKLLAYKNTRDPNPLNFLVKKCLSLASLFTGWRRLNQKITALASQYKVSECEYAMDVVWGSKYFPAKVMADFIEVDFAGHKFFTTAEYDVYLRAVYGDYRQLPPENKRQRHNSVVYQKEVSDE